MGVFLLPVPRVMLKVGRISQSRFLIECHNWRLIHGVVLGPDLNPAMIRVAVQVSMVKVMVVCYSYRLGLVLAYSCPASEMTCIVLSGALNSTHSLTQLAGS